MNFVGEDSADFENAPSAITQPLHTRHSERLEHSLNACSAMEESLSQETDCSEEQR